MTNPRIAEMMLSRRAILTRLTALGLAAPAVAALTVHSAAATPRAATPTPTVQPSGLVHKGVNYDVGTEFFPGYSTRQPSHEKYLSQEIAAIHDQLHCTSVGIFGTQIDRLIAGAEAALAAGLHVRVQPRFIGATVDDTVTQVSELAARLTPLQAEPDEIILDLGCELTLFTDGLIPGSTFEERVATLLANLGQIPAYNRALNDLLQRSIEVSRAHFGGPLTYASGTWEEIDWSGFDYVGIDYYRDSENQATYVADLRALHRHGKPILITEFGCCCFQGAEDMGANTYQIVDWSKEVPELSGPYVRDESVQATYLGELLDIFEREGVHGAFVYQFISPDDPHVADARYDLDMASFAIVKVYPADSDKPYASTGYWEPKEGFHELARRYGAP